MHEFLRPPARLARFVLAASLGAGCLGVNSNLPTQPPTPGGLAALIGPVTLELEQQGNMLCVYARGPGTRFALVWPNGWTAKQTDPLSIIDGDGKQRAAVGESVWVGGGEVPGPYPDLRGCPDGGHVWWVADVTHEEPNIR